MWKGKGRTIKNKARFTAPKDFYFGGRLIRKGSEVEQFETRNFGITVWLEPKGHIRHFATE